MAASRTAFDRDAWATLLQVDRDIAAAAAHLGQFGQQFVDDLAESYLAIGEKRYLSAIVAKIQRRAEDEAGNLSEQNPETTDTNGGANDNAYRAASYAPDFDAGKWERLASSDPDIAAAITEVGRFGSNYVADLAASYQAISEKFYLQRIVDTIVAEARADLASASKMKPAEPASTTGAQSHPWDHSASSPWHGRLERGEQRSSLGDRQPHTNSGTPRPNHKGPYLLGVCALGLFLILFVGVAALTYFEYSTFRNAAGDANRLEAYTRECHVCVFKSRANSEAISLRTITAEAQSFESSRGDVDSLKEYLKACRVCAFSTIARNEIQTIEAEAVRDRDAQARDKAYRQQQQAAEAEAARQRAAEFATDQAKFNAARGDIDRLAAYLGACMGCPFEATAEAELYELRRQANNAAEQKRFAALTARSVTWRMTNSTNLSLGLQFFSQTRAGTRWPGTNMNWPMSPGQTSDYNLACQTGEKICYGAAASYRPETWGVGGFGNLFCENCCVTCDGAVHAFNLMTDGGGPNE